MNLNDKLKQERTGLTASQYSDLQELFVDRYVDGMSTKDLVEYVYNDMMQYVETVSYTHLTLPTKRIV